MERHVLPLGEWILTSELRQSQHAPRGFLSYRRRRHLVLFPASVSRRREAISSGWKDSGFIRNRTLCRWRGDPELDEPRDEFVRTPSGNRFLSSSCSTPFCRGRNGKSVSKRSDTTSVTRVLGLRSTLAAFGIHACALLLLRSYLAFDISWPGQNGLGQPAGFLSR
jgi:hypothetical protein